MRPELLSATAIVLACCSVNGFTSSPRFAPHLGPADDCCPIEPHGEGYVLDWEIRSARAAEVEVSIEGIWMDKEKCQYADLDPKNFKLLPDRPQPLELKVRSPSPVEGRTLSVTLQPSFLPAGTIPMPEPTTSSCKICARK